MTCILNNPWLNNREVTVHQMVTQVTILLHTCVHTYTHTVMIRYIMRLYTELQCAVGEV